MVEGEFFGSSLTDSAPEYPQSKISTLHEPPFAPRRALNVSTIGRELKVTLNASKVLLVMKTVMAETLNSRPLPYQEG